MSKVLDRVEFLTQQITREWLWGLWKNVAREVLALRTHFPENIVWAAEIVLSDSRSDEELSLLGAKICNDIRRWVFNF